MLLDFNISNKFLIDVLTDQENGGNINRLNLAE
jgi:hypothetical protein